MPGPQFLPSKPTRPTFQVSSTGGSHTGQQMTLNTPATSSSSLSNARN